MFHFTLCFTSRKCFTSLFSNLLAIKSVRVHADYASLSALISEFPFVGKCWSNPNVLLEEWHVWLRALMLRCIPFKTSHRVTLPPWVSPESSHLMKKLKALKKGAVKPSATIFQKIQYSEAVLSNALETDKADYESKLAEGRSTKHLFKYFKSLNSSSLIPARIHWGNQTAESATHQCEMFNKYFNSVFSPASTRPEAPSNPVLTDYDISPLKISQTLVGLDVTKSRGPDQLPPVLFKEVPELSLSLSKLFYKIQQTCVFPDQWKVGKISPLFKKGSKADVTNYRPITLLNICSKVFEKCIFDALFEFVYDRIPSCQFGFQKRKSPVLQLLIFLDNIYKGVLNPGNVVETVYLDFSKAFDKINHSILLQKLQHLGVGGNLLKIIKSYLSGRKQYVQIGEATSGFLLVTSGVPQGSILGPLLFLIYVMDITDGLLSLPFLFADDTKLLSIRDKGCSSFLQQDLRLLETWCDLNDMIFNVDKCHLLSFTKNCPSSLILYNEELKTVSSEKDLGIIISTSLKWSEHITYICGKSNRVLSMLKRNSARRLHWHQRLNMYKSMVLPILSYGCCVWNLSKADMKSLEQVQRRASDWILGYPELNYKQRLYALNILPLSMYFQISDLLMLSKLLSKKYNVSLNNHLTPYIQKYSTRNSEKQIFELPDLKLETGRGNFWYRTPRLFNKLVNLLDDVGLKKRLVAFFWSWFEANFDTDKPCTWIFACDCANCRETHP